MLKLDPKNTELLAQKQTVLKENIAQTSEKLKGLKNAQEEVYTEWQNYIKLKPKIEEIANSISKTETQLKGLKKEQEQAQKQFEKGKITKEQFEQIKSKVTECKNSLSSLKNEQKELNKITISTKEYRNYQREIIKTENELKQLKLEASNWTQVSNKLSELSSKMKTLGDTATKVGKTLTTKLTLPIVSVGTIATKSAIDFESAFAGVEKTVDGTAEQMEELRNGIKKMAKEIPSSTTEISAVAEAAGQLGIEVDNILDFTKAMIDLGNSTNLTSEEAASQLAKFANVMQMSQKDFDKLGSSIVDLGNNFATTEKDIVEMSMRLAGAGKQVGLTEGDVLGLATALSSVGVEAEMGGSAFSKTMVKMQSAVEIGGDKLNKVLKSTGYSLRNLELMADNDTKSFKEVADSIGLTKTELKNMITAGSQLEDFAKISGLTAAEFKKQWEEDAAGAISKFIQGLSTAEDKGESAIVLLQDMGLSEVRLRDSLLRASNANDIFTKALETGNKAFSENTALTNEANKRYNTLQSKIEIAKNKLQDIGITFGEIIMPYVEKFINKISIITEKFSNLNPKTQEMIVKIGALIAVLGPALVILGKMITLGGSFFGILSKIASMIAKVSTGTGALSGVLTALSGPIGIVIAAVLGAVAAFALLWNKSETFRKSITEIGQSIINTYNEHIKPTIDNIKEILLMLWNDVLKPLLSFLWDVFSPIIEKVFVTAGQLIANVFDKVSIVIQGITGVLKGLIKFITGVFTGDWEKAWEGIKDIFGSVFNGLKALFKAPINWIISGINKFIGGINKIKIPDWVPGVGGKGINIPVIPQLAKGGIVNKATLAMIGEGKSAEAVIPLDRTLTKYMAEAMKQAGGNTNNITVNFYPKQMTEAELDKAFDYIDRKFGMAY